MLIGDNSLLKGMVETASKLHEFTVQQNQARLKQALLTQMATRLQAIDAKYDGARARELEELIEKKSNQMEVVSGHLSKVEKSISRVVDIKTKLNELKSLAASGQATAFDQKLGMLFFQYDMKDTYIGTREDGGWTDQEIVIDSAGSMVSVTSKMLAPAYYIDVDGTRYKPDFFAKELKGGGIEMKLDDVQQTDQTVLPRNGDTVTVTDGTETVTGTLRLGGAGLLHAWGYNGFATDADKAQVTADIDAAVKALDKAAKALSDDQIWLDHGVRRLSAEGEELNAEWTTQTEEDAAAKQAERDALQARMHAAEMSFAISSAAGIDLIKNMFVNQPSWAEKQTVLGILSGGAIEG